MSMLKQMPFVRAEEQLVANWAGGTPREEARRSPDHSHVFVDGLEYRVCPNGGGLIAISALVGRGVRVSRGCIIRGKAIVSGPVRLFGRCVIEGHAVVLGICTLRDEASVGGAAVVRNGVILDHHARIDGDAIVEGGVYLQHFARIRTGHIAGNIRIG